MRTFIAGDVHGNIDVLEGLLLEAGVIYYDEAEVCHRAPDIYTIHVGDLIDGTSRRASGDRMCLQAAPYWFDTVLVGNHEWPYLGGAQFHGFHAEADIEDIIHDWADREYLVPAYLVDDTILVTHAGVTQEKQYADAEEAYEKIVDRWNMRPLDDSLFQAVAAIRDGSDPFGGIFWADHSEKKNGKFNQVFGHTPMSEPDVKLSEGVYHVNIDNGGKGGARCAGVFIEDGLFLDVVTYVRPPSEDIFD